MSSTSTRQFRLDPSKRVLFLTKDPELIRRQIRGELDLRMEDLTVEDLLDDINTDVMTPAWVCFDHLPERIAQNAYAGLIVDGERLIPQNALAEGGFEVIVSGVRKGTGSSRETAVQAEKYSGIRLAVAASFAPIHARQQHQSGRVDGGSSGLAALAARRDPRTRGVHAWTRSSLRAHRGIRRAVPVRARSGRGRGRSADAVHERPAHEPRREDRMPARAGREAGRSSTG